MASASLVRSSSLFRLLCPIPGNGACADPTAVGAHSRRPPRQAQPLARHRDMWTPPSTFYSLLFCWKKIASHNAHMGIIHIFLAQITTSIRSAYTHQQQVRHHLFVWQACITTSHRPCIQTIHRPLSLLCKWRATINGEKPSIDGMAPLLLPIKHNAKLLSPTH